MPQYRKKPVVIEAEQWDGGHSQRGVCIGPCATNEYLTRTRLAPHLHTIHDNQVVYLAEGDWILPEPDGEHFYPCASGIFAATYEAV
jgi:hypothetical protein